MNITEIRASGSTRDKWAQRCPICGWLYFNSDGRSETENGHCQHLLLEMAPEYLFEGNFGMMFPAISFDADLMERIQILINEDDDPQKAVVKLIESMESDSVIVHKYEFPYVGGCGGGCGGDAYFVWKKA